MWRRNARALVTAVVIATSALAFFANPVVAVAAEEGRRGLGDPEPIDGAGHTYPWNGQYGWQQNADGTWIRWVQSPVSKYPQLPNGAGPAAGEFMSDARYKEYTQIMRGMVSGQGDNGDTPAKFEAKGELTASEASDAESAIKDFAEQGPDIKTKLRVALDDTAAAAKEVAATTSIWTAIGAVTLGPTVFKLGINLGSAFDRLVGLPTFDEGTEEEPEKGPCEQQIEYEGPASFGTQGVKFPKEAGLVITCTGSAFGEARFDGVEYPSGMNTSYEKTVVKVFSKRTFAVAGFTAAWLLYDVGPEHIAKEEFLMHEQGLDSAGMPLEEPASLPMPGQISTTQEAENAEHANKAPGAAAGEAREHLPQTPTNGVASVDHEVVPTPGSNTETIIDHFPKFNEGQTPEEKAREETIQKQVPVGVPPLEIGGIELPELKPPHIEVLCKKFPFGVPCWIIETLEAWSGTGKAPTLGIDEFTIKGQKIGPASVNLEMLEPIMSKVRPWMVVFGTIGLVLLFYSFATGGGAGTGSGSSSGGGGESFAENDAYYNTEENHP